MVAILIFDIETAPNLERARALMPAFDEADVATGNIRDEDKKRAKIAERRASHETSWMDGAALRPETAIILAIGIQPEAGDPVLLHGTDEAEVITSWWDFLETTYQRTGKQFAGWSIFHFDLPSLIIRSRILGVQVPALLRSGRYFNAIRFRDLQEEWLMNRPRNEVKCSLDYVARALGCGEKTGEGSNFAALYMLDQKKALDYLKNDLLICQRIARKLGFT